MATRVRDLEDAVERAVEYGAAVGREAVDRGLAAGEGRGGGGAKAVRRGGAWELCRAVRAAVRVQEGETTMAGRVLV